jgi:glutathione S-transferase
LADTLEFFHAPQSRSGAVAILLAELDAPHLLHLINMKAGEQREPAFLAINPMGKVPAIRHGDALVTEQVAIFIYLADLFPKAGLAPAIGDPLRGPYLRWIAFYGSSFEPAVVDRALKREPGPAAMVPYGTFDTMFDTLTARLRETPYLLGDRISAADILWGTSLRWITAFGLVPELPEIKAYLDRVTGRPSFKTVGARDAELAAEQAAIVAAR